MSNGLEALNVIEVGEGFVAAMSAKLLADLGATVVKIEPPGGDAARRRGPFRVGQLDPEASGTYLYLNSNKRSLVLDLTAPDAQAELEELVRQADLLVHDFQAIDMARHGIDYERFKRLNPRLVLLSITPFGLTGPYRDYAASDLTLYHGGGLGWLCPGKGTPRSLPPITPFGQHAYAQGALHAAVAGLAACYGAAASGVGEHVDVSIQEVVTFFLGRTFASHTYAGVTESRQSPSPYEPQSLYRCKDGYLYIICAEQAQWERLVEVMGHPAWAHEERFATRDQRGEQTEALKTLISQWTEQHTVDELFHACQQARVGAAPMLTQEQLETDAHLKVRQFFQPIDHPVAGTLQMPGAPYKLKEPWWRLRRPAPLLGEANRDRAPRFAQRVPTAASGRPEEPLSPPLTGVRVLDLSWVWAGPYCTMMLAFLGADVIKVESSARLDITRRTKPFPPGMEPGPNRSGYFGYLNQAKKSIGINLSEPKGKDIVRQLAAHCDMMISNYGTGVLERLGLGPEAMHQVNPDLIVAMISAFGQTGPLRQYMGYGPLIAPLAGVAAQTGFDDGVPQDVGMPYGDPNGGTYTAIALTAALLARQRHGKGGQVIDLSMWEAMVCTSYEGWMTHVLGNPGFAPMANHDPVWAPHNVYRCQGDDAWVALAVTEERHWQGLCQALGQPDLAGDARFRDAAARKAHEAELDGLLAAWCERRERWEVTRTLQAHGVPAFPSMSMSDLIADTHLLERDCFTHWIHPEVGQRTLMGAPWRLTRRPNGIGRHAPLLGQHTDEVLETLLQLDAEGRDQLRTEGVIE
jgi:crotonobetainyl-CoA:carnitine CoA-transferase CaiB-like acyl-CoA transferase